VTVDSQPRQKRQQKIELIKNVWNKTTNDFSARDIVDLCFWNMLHAFEESTFSQKCYWFSLHEIITQLVNRRDYWMEEEESLLR
jgi:hypothetical protein